MGRRLCSGELLTVAAQHLPAVLLSHLLVRLEPVAAAIPGDLLFGVCYPL